MTQEKGTFQLADWLWASWLWIGWSLAALLAVTQYWTVAEMPQLGMIVAAIMLLGGALSVSPRLILRKRGHHTLPALMMPVLAAHWVAWAVFIFMHVTTSSRIYSTNVLLEQIGTRLYDALAFEITKWTWGIWIVTLIALFIFASTCRVATARNDRPWRVATLVTAVAIPLIFTVFGVVINSGIAVQRDTAGDTVATVRGYSTEVKTQLVQQRYDEVQGELAEVRGQIDAASSWTFESILIDRSKSFDRHGAESYEFRIEAQLDGQVDAATVARVVADLQSQGWRSIDAKITQTAHEFWAEHHDGRRLILTYDDRDQTTSLRYTSTEWWTGEDQGEIGAACPAVHLSSFFSKELRHAAGDVDPFDRTTPYAADAWPAC